MWRYSCTLWFPVSNLLLWLISLSHSQLWISMSWCRCPHYIIQFQLHDLSLFIMFSLSLFKNNCFLCFGFFVTVKKKKKARRANSHGWWLGILVGLCWCWCSRWLALYDWMTVRHYGKTKPFFFLSCFCVLKLDWFDSLSLSPMVGSDSFYAFMSHDCD